MFIPKKKKKGNENEQISATQNDLFELQFYYSPKDTITVDPI